MLPYILILEPSLISAPGQEYGLMLTHTGTGRNEIDPNRTRANWNLNEPAITVYMPLFLQAIKP